MLIKVDQFAPDADNTLPGVVVDVQTMVPSLKGYKAAPTATDTGITALADTCLGATVVRKLDNVTRLFAGTTTKLYEWDFTNSTWDDATRAVGGNYGATADVRWDYAQFGNVTLACNKADTLQYIDGSGTQFADITGAPKAKLVETVNQFVMIADTNDGSFGDSPDRWWCSAIGDYTDWTPDTATQCVSGRLTSSPGRITALKRLGDGIVAYKDRAMFVGSYVGAPEVWSFQEIPGEVGCMAQNGIVNIGAAHVFVGYDNFYIFDGSRPTPIGNNLKDWFFTDLYTDFAYRIKTIHDRHNSNVYFFYPSRSGAGSLDSCIVYNYRVNKWGVDDRTIEEVIDFVAAGASFESSLASETFASVDPTITFDSPILVAGQPAPAYIGTDHKIYTLTGDPDTWSFTISDFGIEGYMSLLQRVTPRFLTSPSTSQMTNYYRQVMGDSLSTGSTTTYSSGRFDVLKSSRWHRLYFSGTGGGELNALDLKIVQDGEE